MILISCTGAYLKMHGNTTRISECVSRTSTAYPEVRPIDPPRRYDTESIPSTDESLEDNAISMMDLVEAELAAKLHVDHVIDSETVRTLAETRASV